MLLPLAVVWAGFDEQPVPLPNGDFAAGLQGWHASGPGAEAETSGRVRLAAGASLSRTVTVSRGRIENQGQRCIVRARARLTNEGAWLRLRIRCGAAYQDRILRRADGWQSLVAVLDTPPFLPGQPDTPLSMELSVGGDGQADIDAVTVTTTTTYGVMLRVTAMEPDQAAGGASVSIIRRHRDTNHADPERHRYSSRLDRIELGTWVDLRRYLFGDGLATVTVRLEDEVVRKLRLEVGLPPAPAAPGDLDDLLLEEPDAPEPTVIWSATVPIDRGLQTLMLPENRVPPDRFVARIQTTGDDLQERWAWLQSVLPDDGPLPTRIPVAANISALDGLLNHEELAREMAILRRIGISATARSLDSPMQDAFDAVRRPALGDKPFPDRLYARLNDEDLLSPYGGDQLAKKLNTRYSALAARLRASGDAQHIALIELMDEPPDYPLTAEDLPAFRDFLRRHGVSPAQVGAASWEDVRPWQDTPSAHVTEQEAPDLPDVPDLEMAGETEVALELETRDDSTSADEQTLSPDALPARRLRSYTRRFAAQRTARIFHTATAAVEAQMPDVHTSVNFRSGVRRVLLPETADWFEFGRQRAVTMLWNEDWLNTYGWRRHGIQSVSYYTELMHAAARPHDLPHGCFVIVMGHTLEKAYSALAHGARRISFWRYGPAYANYLPYSWSHSREAVLDVATFTRDVAAIEDILVEAERPAPAVGLLYAKADALWGRSQAENILVGFALLHAQVPWELVTETEIEEDDILTSFRTLYITDVSVNRATQQVLADWVARGGRIWFSGEAATRDEFNSPCTILRDAATAAQERVYVATDRPGERYVAPVRKRFNRQHGKGRLQGGWPAQPRAEITDFAGDDVATRPVAVNTACIEATLYRHAQTDLLFLIDYTGLGEPQDIEVIIRDRPDITQVESLRLGALKPRQQGRDIIVNLRLDRADTLKLHHQLATDEPH